MPSKHVTATSSSHALMTFGGHGQAYYLLSRLCQLPPWARQDEAVIGVARRQMDDVSCRWPVLKKARSPRDPVDCPGRRASALGG